ncbi:sensor histidine kinase [Bacillus sp. PS06]|uniref:sensor histidine kinase n=1 Tax=Bacillus sp. PS06 TaxID=2764176 RepID=UPI001784A201|nr:HAMP domain-containing sensor histidine kinase [Bacillus sp. PS06]MBD8067867.1 ATP-binding protein [Bacillus sp. PS06]
MKDFYTEINKSYYYKLILAVIFLMVMGLLFINPLLSEHPLGYYLHIVLVLSLATSILLYPRFESQYLRILIILIASAYFYTIFFLYPNTWTGFIFLCMIPGISIFFFDSKLFYFSLVVNSILMMATFSYISLTDLRNIYPDINQDLIGNIINFFGSQIFLYLIFHLTYARIKKLKIYYEEIQHSERLRTTGQLAAAVAHEIRNPLTVVNGFLQLYESDPSFNKDVKRNFSLMIDELKTAENVISQFLSIAKPNGAIKLETVNVKTSLESVTDLLKSYGLFHDNNIDLFVKEECFIPANNIEFKQLIINLIKNAIEASNDGDTVTVVVEPSKKNVEIKIKDQGCGMSREEIKSLGTPFYSLKSKGTGLGMMICFNIVEKYNGSIHFESAKGEGTTVILRFPAKTRQEVILG